MKQTTDHDGCVSKKSNAMYDHQPISLKQTTARNGFTSKKQMIDGLLMEKIWLVMLDVCPQYQMIDPILDD